MTAWPVEVEVDVGRAAAVVLRAPDPIDAEAIADAVNSSLSHLGRFLDWAGERVAVDDQAVRQAIAREAFEAGGDAMYTVFEGNEVVGAVGLHRRLGAGALEIGYWLRAGAEGRGIMTASVRAVARLAFEVDGAERVVIVCHPDNARSAAIPARLGFALVEVDDRPRMVWELRRDGAPTIR